MLPWTNSALFSSLPRCAPEGHMGLREPKVQSKEEELQELWPGLPHGSEGRKQEWCKSIRCLPWWVSVYGNAVLFIQECVCVVSVSAEDTPHVMGVYMMLSSLVHVFSRSLVFKSMVFPLPHSAAAPFIMGLDSLRKESIHNFVWVGVGWKEKRIWSFRTSLLFYSKHKFEH